MNEQPDALARALSVFERRRGDIPFEVYEAFQELRAALSAFAARPPVGVEPVEYQYRFWIEDRGMWSGWAPIRKSDHDRIADVPEEGRQVRALYTAPSAPAAVPVDIRQLRDAVLHASHLATHPQPAVAKEQNS
ncbi:hypothetical protein XccvBFoX4_gp63c [Xanthomonas phage FoX4]|uniref:Uncharacterized protein n=1 Tax=Xanthomonas phage FoX4 TaxID=2723900 RepID=A0A858WM07_9CAUD|nr:hypothetical protein KNU97_gp63 [Xanthomonas phage FoX4]QJI53017.1 hypothetical protein XccvBFoX4_gp63c [Xanthomonas phage FoX4]